uniref:Cytochrome c oxidase subunit 2 n=1 Tax=Paratapes textilis TaxID=990946 RepID=H6BHT7_9BIVA|nr:cytochrome c oxidase subunit II [Paratapes textilis]AEH99628.1 cytochrome c oxidase subunit II [Paratapes textilis]
MMGWDQIGFVDPVSFTAGSLACYHDLVMVVVVMVLTLVGWFTTVVFFSWAFSKGQLELTNKKNETLEVVWTVTPAFLLFGIGFVSLINLYFMNVAGQVSNTFSAVGHQWFWEYVYELDYEKSASKDKSVDTQSSYLQEKYNEWKEFSDGMSKISSNDVPDPVSLVKFLQEKHGIKMNSTVTLLEYLEKMSMGVESFMSKLEGAYRGSKSACGDYTELMALEMVNSVLVESNSLFEEMASISSSWEKMISEDLKVFEAVYGSLFNKVMLELDERLFSSMIEGFSRVRYSSLLVDESDLVNNTNSKYAGFRKAEVTIPCFMCRGVKNEVLVSTADVMHSWGVPGLGVKVDAIPGRVNSLYVTPEVCGLFYGFCYELCGSGHSSMPINVVVLEKDSFEEALFDTQKMAIKGFSVSSSE